MTVLLGAISLKEGTHLTARNKQILTKLIEADLMQGGTKLIQFVLKKESKNEYSYKQYERFKKSSRTFSLKPEDQVVKWHYMGSGIIIYK